MGFLVIHTAPGLSAVDRRRARASGPWAGATRSTYRELLESAGFDEIEDKDVTSAFVATQGAWIRERAQAAAVLTPLLPEGEFEQRQAEHVRQLAATKAGLLQRSLFLATRPARRPPRPTSPTAP